VSQQQRRRRDGRGPRREGGSPAAPSQRQLRVAEQMRHVIAEALTRGEVHDPDLAARSVTVGEVRVSRDLRSATVYAAELGRPLSAEAASGLQRAARHLAGRVAREMNLKYAPHLTFVADGLYDHAARLEGLIREQVGASSSAAAAPPRGDDDAGA
jgi:ribosome-binding factor A